MNPLNYRQLDDLHRAVVWAQQEAEPFRVARDRHLRQYAGPEYGSAEEGEQGADLQPVNLLNFAVRTLANAVVPLNPRVNITTKYRALKPQAAKFKEAGNGLFSEIDLGETLEFAFVDSLFGPNMVKVSLTHAGQVEIDGFMHDVTDPYCDPVSIDHAIYDFAAKRWDQQGYMGDIHVVDFERFMDSRQYRNKDQLNATDFANNTDYLGLPRARDLQRRDARIETYRPQLEKCDIWLPYEGLIVSLPSPDNDWARPLRIVEWEGLESGPYIPNFHQFVPDNLLPISPTSRMIDLHHLANLMFRKLSRQAIRQKSLTIYQRGDDEDIDAIANADDGDTVGVLNPQAAQEISFGGPDQLNLALFMTAMNLFYEINGGLNSVAGLGAAAETLGQERIIHQAATGQIREMSERFQKFIKKVMIQLLWYEHSEPLRDRKIHLKIAGSSGIDTWFGPEDRQGDFFHYDVNVQPYSLVNVTPAERAGMLQQLIERVVLPLYPMMQQQQGQIRVEGLIRTLAEYQGLDEIGDLIQWANPQYAEPVPPGRDRRMPAHTSREYTRTNRSERRGGFDPALIAQLAGGGAGNPPRVAGAA